MLRFTEAGELLHGLTNRGEVTGQLLLGKRSRLGQNLVHRAGVAMDAIHEEFIVQVGARRRAGGTDGANHGALFHPRPFLYLEPMQM